MTLTISGEEQVSARYVVGCDGGNSFVRARSTSASGTTGSPNPGWSVTFGSGARLDRLRRAGVTVVAPGERVGPAMGAWILTSHLAVQWNFYLFAIPGVLGAGVAALVPVIRTGAADENRTAPDFV